MNLENIDPRKLLVAVVSLFIGLVVLTIVWFVATHGRLVVERADKNTEYTVVKASEQALNGEVKTYASSSILIASDAYVVRYDDGRQIQTKYIKVPGFLQAARVNFDTSKSSKNDSGAPEGPRHIERVAPQTLDHIGLGKNGSIVSFNVGFDATKRLLVHPVNDPQGLGATIARSPFVGQNVLASNNHLIGFVLRVVNGESAETLPAIYNLATGEIKKANQAYTIAKLIAPSTANNNSYGVGYYVYSQSRRIDKLDVFTNSERVQTFADITQADSNVGGDKTVAISKNYVAIGYGESHPNPSLKSRKNTKLSRGYTLKVFRTSDKKQIADLDIGEVKSVTSIQINDSGDYISVVQGDLLTVYNTQSAEAVYSYQLPFIISRPQWLNNDQIIFGSVQEGIFKLDVRKQAANTLFTSDDLKLNSYDIVGNKILFTAYPRYNQEKNLSTPDGYIAYLDKAASDDNQLVVKLPAETNSFKVSTLRQTIYASPKTLAGFTGPNPEFRPVNNVSENYKKLIRRYLDENLTNYQQYKLVYGENL